jgi:serine phosphatase RsbU (regulator of sigma subunit)
LWYSENGKLIEIKADKQPIGKTYSPKPFTTHTLEVSSDARLFLFTDGYPDQFGGDSTSSGGKKLKYKNFLKILEELDHHQFENGSMILKDKFVSWKGELEQTDDVCVIGFRI